MNLPDLSPPFEPGTVWLVGAGPGDPGLLTLHAVNALRQADAVVYDALIGDGILALAREGALLEFAGKRGGKPSPRQADITGRLIALAREGKRVLRLKGGDPFVFGRGGEEATALAEAGIPFRVVPGVSSGLAALALHGIPGTTRDTNHALILATGHSAQGDEIEWAALARTGAPIVLYMAVANLSEIVAKLRQGGLAGSTPAAVVCGATTANERVVETTLSGLAELAAGGAISTPAVVAIGAIAGVRARLREYLMSGSLALSA
jgi:uroporphyrin-III C-methyltransferase